MNETIRHIHSRFSCRAFTGKPVTDEQARALAEAGAAAPSAMNLQPWRILVLRDKALLDELEAEGSRVMQAMPDKSLAERIASRGGRLFYNAPCMIFLPADSQNPVGSALDCGIAGENIALAAQSMGLGSCFCGLARLAFSEEKRADFEQRLGYPEGYEFGTALLVGEPADTKPPHPIDNNKIRYID